MDYHAWRRKEIYAQQLHTPFGLPLSASDREGLMSGYCGPCWDEDMRDPTEGLEPLKRERP